MKDDSFSCPDRDDPKRVRLSCGRDPERTRYIMLSSPSSRGRAIVHRTIAFRWFESVPLFAK